MGRLSVPTGELHPVSLEWADGVPGQDEGTESGRVSVQGPSIVSL